MARLPDLAYYYPEPYWQEIEGGQLKSLLLFFDKIGILLPRYMYGQHLSADMSLADPLEERGLLEVLEPTEWIGDSLTQRLAEAMVDLLAWGAFDGLSSEGPFHELSYSRIGYGSDAVLAEFLVDELKERGLARPTRDGVSVPLHPTVRKTILVLIAQLSRLHGSDAGYAVHPVTSRYDALADLTQVLPSAGALSQGSVLLLDLEPVGLDVSEVPLDEVLQFRAEHAETHRSYMRSLRGFMTEIAGIESPDDREKLLALRKREIEDAAVEIRRAANAALGKDLASWSLGIAGTAWAATTGDILGAVLAGLGLGVLGIEESEQVTAYSYLVSAQKAFGG